MAGKMTSQEYNNPLSTSVRSGGFRGLIPDPNFLPLGSEAPDFTLGDLSGNQVSLSQFRDKSYVILEFGSIT